VLTAPSALIGQGFFSSSDAQDSGRDWPNIQMFFLPMAPSKGVRESFARGLRLVSGNEILKELMDPHHGKDGFSLLPLLVRPKGRGEVTLKDKNPFSDPLIGE